MSKDSFDWDTRKDLTNQAKHGVSFSEAQYAFADPHGAGYWRKGKKIYEREN